MTSAAQPSAGPGFDWEAAGRAYGTNLDALHAIAVLGSDDENVARVAIGIGRQQAWRRRVAIGDLIGNVPALEELVPSDDPHGLSDVFDYGLSFDRVARRVEDEKQLYIVPTGSFVTDQAEIMANRRWTKLAAGFRERDGLLILCANVDTPEIESLVLQLDAAIIVGSRVPPLLPQARIFGTIRGPEPVADPASFVERRKRPSRYVVRAPSPMFRIGSSIGIILAALIASMGIWLSSRPFARSTWAPAWLRGVPISGDSAYVYIRGFDTAGVLDDSTSTLATARGLGLLTAQDSASRSPFGISLINFNTQAGALLELKRLGTTLRAGTFTPILIRETPWFRVVAGAYPDSVSAAALLDTLKTQGTSDAGRAVIERFPYALLVERNVADSAVASRLAAFQRRGLPVYALLQSDGTTRLFAGAFKSPEEATLLHEAMKNAGVQTSLVYRTGRVY